MSSNVKTERILSKLITRLERTDPANMEQGFKVFMDCWTAFEDTLTDSPLDELRYRLARAAVYLYRLQIDRESAAGLRGY